jgi:glycosyltransferase involved in cell wall biosynthesis
VKTIAIISSIIESWGGSEELWARTVPLLIKQGHRVYFLKADVDENHFKIQELKKLGMAVINISAHRSIVDKYLKHSSLHHTCNNYQFHLERILSRLKPQLFVVSQGINFDGLIYAYVARQLKIPYITIAQKAVDVFWPAPNELAYLRATQTNARKSIFVSRKNLEITEMQLGEVISNAIILRNPVKKRPTPLPYPTVERGFKLACIGRYFLLDKGQDMLIRVLARPKWKARNLRVTFFGKGENEQAIRDLLKFYHVNAVEMLSHIENGEDIWRDYHALILPSRFEGQPLVLLEAMAAGRTAIVTNAGGMEETLKDSTLGFVSQPTEEDLEKVMEQAWQRRNEWQNLGANCFKLIEKLYQFPAEEDLLQIINTELNVKNG